jgi:hypothetical protein
LKTFEKSPVDLGGAENMIAWVKVKSEAKCVVRMFA